MALTELATLPNVSVMYSYLSVKLAPLIMLTDVKHCHRMCKFVNLSRRSSGAGHATGLIIKGLSGSNLECVYFFLSTICLLSCYHHLQFT